MQVKKFEARSMKEALEMIKKDLGPDAIILSAKDNAQRFGLVGQGSVEVTAAISESSLQKKKFVENRMPDRLKEDFHKTSARSQKEWVEKLIQSYRTEDKAVEVNKKVSYIDIKDEPRSMAAAESRASGTPQDSLDLRKEIEDLKSWVQQLKNETRTSGGHNLSSEGLLVLENLKNQGLREELSLSLLDEAKKALGEIKYRNRAHIEGWLVAHIMKTTLIQQPNRQVQIFVGPSGSGKTSLMIKWASDLILNHKKKVAILTTDNLKTGSVQQVRMYAQILNVPFAVIRGKQDWSFILEQLKDYDHILCDFPGQSLHSDEEKLNLRSLLPSLQVPCDIHLVLNTLTNLADLNQTYLNYKIIQPNFLSFSHVDEANKKAVIYELSTLHRKPLFAFSLGRKIPDDFELATKERVCDFVLKLSTQGGRDVYR